MRGHKYQLIGQVFDQLTVLEQALSGKKHGTQWKCYCKCGNYRIARGSHLVDGVTKNCGDSKKHPRKMTLKFRKHLSQIKRLAPGRAGRNAVLGVYKTTARRRSLKWNLTDAQFDILVTGDCFYCGDGPSSTFSFKNRKQLLGTHSDFKYNGIDRIDSNLDYIMDNAVTCCKTCNRAKSDLPVEEFYTWIKRLTVFQESTLAKAV